MHAIVKEDIDSIIKQPLNWEAFRKKTVLITGANGFLAGYMVETLLYLNSTSSVDCSVTGLVRNLPKAISRFAEYKTRGDLCLIEADVSQGVPEIGHFDYIIHAASQASPKYYKYDPVGTMTANLNGTYHLLDLAKRNGCDRFLLFSSGEVYGSLNCDKVPTKESDYGYLDILDQRSCYAESKRAAETLVICYGKQFNVPCVIVRPFHTYGPGISLSDGRVFADFVCNVVEGKNIVMRSDGTAVRAFCYVSDAVGGFFTAMLKGDNCQAYNVGNPHGAISIRQLAELFIRLYPERHLKVISEQAVQDEYMPSPIEVNSPNIDKISQLGWLPTYLPAQGFYRTIEYFLNAN